MPSLLDMGPYAGFDPRRSPHLLNNPPRDPSQVDASGAFLKGQAAGLLGFPADMVQMMADVQAGANRVAPMQVPFTSNKIGSLLGADPQTRDFQAGLIGAPDISDVGRLAGKGLLAQALFHGTPHKFDKFDLKAIGTGEGAQAYGHGLYFAENPGVAGSYKTLKTKESFDMASWIKSAGSKDEALKQARKMADNPNLSAAQKKEIYKQVADLENYSEGHLYEVDIPDETIAKMLDWDAPLSEQPEILKKLRNLANDPDTPLTGNTASQLNDALQSFELNSTSGETIVRLLGGDEVGSQLLNEAGIPGIRFFDGSSRYSSKGHGPVTDRAAQIMNKTNDYEETAKQLLQEFPFMKAEDLTPEKLKKTLDNRATRNIVVFNPDDIKTVKRDGELVYKTGKGGGLLDAPSKQKKLPEGVQMDFRDRTKFFGEPTYELETLNIPDDMQGRGVGTDIMQDLTQRADSEGATIILNADSTVSGRKGSKAADKRLIQFYKRHGFVENKGRNKDFRFGGPTQKNTMYRTPNQQR